MYTHSCVTGYFVEYGFTNNKLNQASSMTETRGIDSIHSFIIAQNKMYSITIIGTDN